MSLDFSWETDVGFSHAYSKGLFGTHLVLIITALVRATNARGIESISDISTEFGKIWTIPWFLALQGCLYLLLVCWIKRKCGSSPRLPSESGKGKTRQTSGAQKIDFTKGPLLRRIMQRIKYCKSKLSPLQYLAKGMITLLIVLVLVTYVVFCFGAPLNFPPFAYFLQENPSEFSETTLAFGLLLTIHAAFPIVLVYGSDTVGGGIMYIFFNREDESKDSKTMEEDNNCSCHFEPMVECLYVAAMGAIIGAWFGAFPIPLDWDREWQVWPIPCNIGLAVGLFCASLVLLYKSSQLKRKRNSSSILTSIKTKKS